MMKERTFLISGGIGDLVRLHSFLQVEYSREYCLYHCYFGFCVEVVLVCIRGDCLCCFHIIY